MVNFIPKNSKSHFLVMDFTKQNPQRFKLEAKINNRLILEKLAVILLFTVCIQL